MVIVGYRHGRGDFAHRSITRRPCPTATATSRRPTPAGPAATMAPRGLPGASTGWLSWFGHRAAVMASRGDQDPLSARRGAFASLWLPHLVSRLQRGSASVWRSGERRQGVAAVLGVLLSV